MSSWSRTSPATNSLKPPAAIRNLPITVLETLTLGSHFYLPSSTSDEIKANLVDAVISELGLVKAKDTIVGDEKIRGVSGGERKRCSIAQQLLTDPAVLFLDEPTSGLGIIIIIIIINYY